MGETRNNISVNVTTEPLSIEEAFEFVNDKGCGGNALFAGTTRERTGQEETETLIYEADNAMATSEMERIVNLAMNSFTISRVFVAHRVGSVGVGEISIIVAVSSAHRDAAFLAARYLIDTLKEFLPIWKLNVDSSGASHWIEPTGPRT